jgi:hypothetical protein
VIRFPWSGFVQIVGGDRRLEDARLEGFAPGVGSGSFGDSSSLRLVVAGGGFSIRAVVDVAEDGDGPLQRGRTDARLLMVENPRGEALFENVWRHRCLELRMADEEDDGQKRLSRQAKADGEGANVEIVLVERILEGALAAVDLLCPPGLPLRTENPATVVLGLDDEDPERGDDHVVDLGGAMSIGTRQIEVVEGVVKVGVQSRQGSCDHCFSQPAFESAGPQKLEENEDRNQRE